MYARVITSQIHPGKMDEWIAILRDSIVPAIKERKGFTGFVVLADPITNKGIAYSVWESEAALKATESDNFYQQQVSKLFGVFAIPPVRELYEMHILAEVATETETEVR